MAVGGISGAGYLAPPASQVAGVAVPSRNRDSTGTATEPFSPSALVGRSVSSLIASDSLGVLIQTQEVARRGHAQTRQSALADAQKAGQELERLVSDRTRTAADRRAAIVAEENALIADRAARRQEAAKAGFQLAAQKAEKAIEVRVALRNEAEAVAVEKRVQRHEQNQDAIRQAYLREGYKAAEQALTARKAAIAENQEERLSLRKELVEQARERQDRVRNR